MNFVIEPTLEHLALVKVAAELWNQPNIRDIIHSATLFYECNYIVLAQPLPPYPRNKKWQKIEQRVLEKLSELMIPSTLKFKLFHYIPPIGLQILKWVEYHLKSCRLDFCLPNEFCWTSQGTIDKKKTAELLIKDSCVPIVSRFKLACFYCLEHDIPKLWNELPESEKIAINNEVSCDKFFHVSLISHSEVLLFWMYYLHEKMDDLYELIKRQSNLIMSPHLFAFNAAVNSGNASAVEYFFRKKRPGRMARIRTTMDIALSYCGRNLPGSPVPDEYYTEVLFFLLSQMSCDQQKKVFKRCSSKILMCCLSWPWQSLFLKTASHLWNFFREKSYNSMLESILLREYLGYNDYNYRKLFQDFWQEIPCASKSYVIRDTSVVKLIEMLFYAEDKQTIRLMFKDLSNTEKNELIFDNRGLIICKFAKNSDNWDMLKFFFQLCLSSKMEMIQLKRQYVELAITRMYTEADRIRNKWNNLLELMGDCIREYDEKENSSTKRLCSDMALGVKKQKQAEE